MTTPKQAAANRANSQRSTGAQTEAGKAVVASNAIKHGILSRRLILDGEIADDYSQLLDGLIEALKPAGSYELVLVEKMAAAIWRQARLTNAERAGIELSRQKRRTGFYSELDALLDIEPLSAQEQQAQQQLRYAMQSAPISNEQLTRYQAALDAELYRAASALRKQQEWRLKFLELAA